MMQRSVLLSIVLILVLILGVLSGFTLEKILFLSPKTDSIPVPVQSIQNPLIQHFLANANGEVTQKGEDYFILKHDGRTLKVYVDDDSQTSTFFEDTAGEMKTASFADIKIGDNLEGGVSIFNSLITADSVKQYKLGDIVAHRFTIHHN